MTIFYILITTVIGSIIVTAIKMQSAHRKELNELMQLFEDKPVRE